MPVTAMNKLQGRLQTRAPTPKETGPRFVDLCETFAALPASPKERPPNVRPGDRHSHRDWRWDKGPGELCQSRGLPAGKPQGKGLCPLGAGGKASGRSLKSGQTDVLSGCQLGLLVCLRIAFPVLQVAPEGGLSPAPMSFGLAHGDYG